MAVPWECSWQAYPPRPVPDVCRQPPARAGREGLVADRAARVGEWARSEEGARELQGMCLKIKSMLGL